MRNMHDKGNVFTGDGLSFFPSVDRAYVGLFQMTSDGVRDVMHILSIILRSGKIFADSLKP